MQKNTPISEWLASSALGGANQTYIEELYEDYLRDPDSVDESWQQIFNSLPKSTALEHPHSQVRDYFKRLARDNSKVGAGVIDPNVSARLINLLQWVNAHRNQRPFTC